MNKITKLLLIVAGILLVIYLLVNGYIKDSENIAKLVGGKIGGGELSMADYYSLAQCVETYTDYLTKKDYESAYNMINHNFRDYMPFEEYQNKVSKIDYSKTIIKDIEAITTTTYCVTVDASGEQEKTSLIINQENNNFLLLPFSFLDYKNPNIQQSKKSTKCVLNNYVVNINQTIFQFEITNRGNEEVMIRNGKLYTNLDDKIDKEVNVTIAPKETKIVEISFDTDYAFPKKVILYRSNGEKADIEYSFEIE